MEADLIRAAKRGDADAFETLMGAYERRVYGLCLRMMGNAHDGEDAAQEAMIRIWQKIGQCREEDAFSVWVYRVTASACTDALRRRRVQPSLDALREDGFEPADHAATPEAACERREERRELERAVSQVPTQMRAVFLLRDVHGMSEAETARALGISKGTVKSRLSRAREKIAGAIRARHAAERGERDAL